MQSKGAQWALDCMLYLCVLPHIPLHFVVLFLNIVQRLPSGKRDFFIFLKGEKTVWERMVQSINKTADGGMQHACGFRKRGYRLVCSCVEAAEHQQHLSREKLIISICIIKLYKSIYLLEKKMCVTVVGQQIQRCCAYILWRQSAGSASQSLRQTLTCLRMLL